MAEQFTIDWAKNIIDENVQKAQTFIDDPEQIQGLLDQLQEKLKDLPSSVGNAFSNVPVMVDMVKSYVTREYTEVSPKVIISLVAAFVYLVKKEDVIPDNIPIVGFADDLAVATVAMMINEPELNAFAAWKAGKNGQPVELVAIEPVSVSEPSPEPAPAPAPATAEAPAPAPAEAPAPAPAAAPAEAPAENRI